MFTRQKLLKKIIPKPIYVLLWILLRRKYKRSYSQMGEDLILDSIFYDLKKGFYVDVGANSPWVASNTMFFYEKGWNGINIDATPGSMKIFNVYRKRDVNLEIPISETEEILKYYLFRAPVLLPSSLSTFDEKIAKNHADLYKVKFYTKELKTQKLEWVLDKYCPDKEIDFLSVDTEGFDLKVLKSNNWEKYRPKIIVIECAGGDGWRGSDYVEIVKFLEENNYAFYYDTSTNALFLENTFLKKRFPAANISK